MARPAPPSFSAIPDEKRSLLDRICAGLPEAELADNGVGCALRVRRRSFGTLFAMASPHTGATQTLLVLFADPDERAALAAIGHPYFAVRNSSNRIGLLLDEVDDDDEVAELVTEAYRQVAPKKLVATLPDPSE